jgi:N-acetylmuramoyl-L-alanine amidase
MKKICLDPGHGGKDAGADGPTGLNEAPVVLEICHYMKPALESFGLSVKMTRTTEIFVELGARCAIANEWGADYFLSVHLNSDGPSAEGVETLYASEAGRALAEPLQAAVLSATGDRDRGLVRRGNLYVLNGTRCAAALSELAFVSHPEHEAKLRSTEYKQLLAWALVMGLAKFLNIPTSTQPK